MNYGRIVNNVRVQDAAFQALITNYQNAVLTAQREVEDGLIGFLNAQRRTELLELSAAAAKRSQDLAVLLQSRGITDFTTVLTAEQNLLQQQDALAVSRGDIPTNLMNLSRAWRRLGDPRWTGFRPIAGERGNAKADRLGWRDSAGRGRARRRTAARCVPPRPDW